MNKYYVGNIKKDAKLAQNGWIMGTFLGEEDPRKSKDMEVKYWEFPEGTNDHPVKVSGIVEFTVLLEGETEALLDGKIANFKAGDYVVIQPGVPNNLVKNVLKAAKGITVKAPSDPSAKKVI